MGLFWLDLQVKVNEAMDKGFDKLQKKLDSMDDKKKEKTLNKLVDVADAMNNASDFVHSASDKITGNHTVVRPVITTPDGVVHDTASKGARAGDVVGNTIKNIVNALTPEQWKQVGMIAYKLIETKIPILAVIDWNKVSDVANRIFDGESDVTSEGIEWKKVARALFDYIKTSDTEIDPTIRVLLDLVEKIVGYENGQEFHVEPLEEEADSNNE